jgi:PAS domain S-box-containing protein
LYQRLFKGQGTKARIAFGQAGMLVSLILTAAILGLLPDRAAETRQSHAALAEAVAANSSVFLTRSDLKRMRANLETIVERNSDILSAGIRMADGKLMVAIADHETEWHETSDDGQADAQVFVPIFQGKSKWGQVELRFPPLQAEGWIGWLSHPLFQLILFITVTSFVLFFFYLGRMLKQLDPFQAIPGRVRSALDTMAEGLLVIDARQNIVLANSAFAEIIGRDPDDLMGFQVGDFPWVNIDAEAFDNDLAPWTLALKKGEQQINSRLRLELVQGRSWTFMVNSSPVLADSGKAGGVLISFDDVTELEEKEIELQKSKEEADAANQSKSDFLANMSHEIRTPMNAILGFTDALRRGFDKNSSESQKYLNTIYSSGSHLLDLINDILDLSKVEAGHIEIEELSFMPHQLVHEVVKIMTVRAAEKGIFVEYKPEGPLPEQIESDPGKIRQILTNLIGNAIKFTESGGVTVVTWYSSEDSQLSFAIHDTGIGMTEGQAATVFESFVQADNSITRRFGGTGLGLAISKRYSEALGGDILVSSVPDQGSVFTCTIKAPITAGSALLEPEQLLLDDQVAAQDLANAWAFPQARILAVDDGEENLELLTLVLRELELDVDSAMNGKMAVELVEQQQYDLILMDVSMPVMDGYEAVGLMREQGLKIPIIALTAHAMKGAEEQCLAAGYSGYMTKPIDIEKLTAELARELNAKKVTVGDEPVPLQSRETGLSAESQLEDDYDTLPIRSSLPQSNPRVRELISKFIVRLDEQLANMEQAFHDGDFSELANLAHWLKGSGGSIGFHDFTEPAKALEDAAHSEQFRGISDQLRGLRQLASRIEPVGEAAESPGDDKSRLVDSPAGGDNTDQSVMEAASDLSQPSADTTPIYSSLPMKNEKFRDLVEQFVSRLDEQLGCMDQACADADHEELTKLGHWLKGSAGSVGFHDFTAPAVELENAAKEGDDQRITLRLKELRHLFNRIELVPEEGTRSPAG